MEPTQMLVFVCVIGLSLVFRLIADPMDRSRITQYLASRGKRVASIHWKPFGRGWFGERNARIYQVDYYTPEGDLHRAICKTSMMAGVYFSDDHLLEARAGYEEEVVRQAAGLEGTAGLAAQTPAKQEFPHGDNGRAVWGEWGVNAERSGSTASSASQTYDHEDELSAAEARRLQEENARLQAELDRYRNSGW